MSWLGFFRGVRKCKNWEIWENNPQHSLCQIKLKLNFISSVFPVKALSKYWQHHCTSSTLSATPMMSNTFSGNVSMEHILKASHTLVQKSSLANLCENQSYLPWLVLAPFISCLVLCPLLQSPLVGVGCYRLLPTILILLVIYYLRTTVSVTDFEPRSFCTTAQCLLWLSDIPQLHF